MPRWWPNKPDRSLFPPDRAENGVVNPIALVPHTHWDREWYLTFEEFRGRLVATMDAVLSGLRSDERWTHFHLDGQTAMVDDYLSLRPEME